MNSHPRTLLITGSSSMIGDFLLPALTRRGFSVQALSRRPGINPEETSEEPGRLHWYTVDLTQKDVVLPEGADTLIHLAPLWLLPPLIPALSTQGIKRVLAFGSTSVLTKMDSASAHERWLMENLTRAETDLAQRCADDGIHWTIFRPTLVYHLGRDKNVSVIAHFIRRFGFFPLVGEGTGLRQPVHAEDLAGACLAALDAPATYGQSYNLSGGETISYRAMVTRLFTHYHKPPRIVTLPLSWLRLGLSALALWPAYRYLTPDMADRINRDMCFDTSQAVQDFGYQARGFLQEG